MNANDIRQHAADALAANDYTAVAAAMKVVTVTAEARLCYAIESAEAVEASGNDPTAMLNILLADPNGIMIFQKLSSSAGVMWAHPKTQQLLGYFVAYKSMPQAVMNALINLSAPVGNPFAEATAEQCQQVIEADILDSKITDWRQRVDALLNQFGTYEQPDAVIAIQVIASEMVVA